MKDDIAKYQYPPIMLFKAQQDPNFVGVVSVNGKPIYKAGKPVKASDLKVGEEFTPDEK